MSSIFGNIFRVSTFGESHGVAVGCVIDGCPSGIEISEFDIQKDLDLRRPGQSHITTDRNEGDKVEILSGIFEGKTTGTPICMIVRNADQRSHDYSEIKDIFRPSHADFVYQMKYGIRDYRGGGRSSARETLARVAAGAVAKKILSQKGIEIFSFTQQVYNIKTEINPSEVKKEDIFSNIVRCPDKEISLKMIDLIEQMKSEGDSVGGVICGVVKNCPVGLGQPVAQKLSSSLASAMMSINAVKGFEIGSGFASSLMKGSEHNDEICNTDGEISTKTNHAGGIVAGISNGEDIIFKVAFKPVSTIKKPQNSINTDFENIKIDTIKGRHDPCVLPRAVPIVDAMSAITILDHLIMENGLKF
ncbi:chorismate synthase [Candidatus Deianiraea vastatrix]|uniref:Chorismate synthase n=1 Tax=Candidatus Deianiraea vastatrix TaxID=2163644 RepID=A0A5B8XEX1_9RICK|nr:chorismate synthase [Candidatus Deianiraea vastatrix]QED22964.1 Chorismate synthase [Candidatus Deianiraea vastatrix]